MKLIDTHAHINREEYINEQPDIINRARSAGIEKIYIPNIDLSTIDSAIQLCDKYSECKAMIGLHPCDVDDKYKDILDQMSRKIHEYEFVGIGEIGLDYYKSTKYKEEQKVAYKTQIEWALENDLPIIIHSREAYEDNIKILSSYNIPFNGIIHCYSGTIEQASEYISLGFKLGIGGIITYPNSGLREVVEQIDLEHIVLETDCPFLAPAPYRGKRNEPSYLLYILEEVAKAKNEDIELVADITTENAKQVFMK